jgi:hypothetical protein
MNDGAMWPLIGKLLRFNGGLFEDPTALPLSKADLQRLLDAARASWVDVEPAIFGTLLERALDPRERHRLGAHYTPRAYVERLVKPTIEDPAVLRRAIRQKAGIPAAALTAVISVIAKARAIDRTIEFLYLMSIFSYSSF